jgi:ribosomal protein S18 acetylase RimI-like enzyme
VSPEQIRPASADDAPAVAACVNAAYSLYLERMDRPPAPMLADYKTLIAESVVWVLPGEGRLRGVLVMMPREGDLFLENIAVYPDDQGRGLGRMLMAFVEQQARTLGLSAIELYTNAVMTENLAFYPRLGFVETGRQLEDGYHRVFMRKALS